MQVHAHLAGFVGWEAPDSLQPVSCRCGWDRAELGVAEPLVCHGTRGKAAASVVGWRRAQRARRNARRGVSTEVVWRGCWLCGCRSGQQQRCCGQQREQRQQWRRPPGACAPCGRLDCCHWYHSCAWQPARCAAALCCVRGSASVVRGVADVSVVAKASRRTLRGSCGCSGNGLCLAWCCAQQAAWLRSNSLLPEFTIAASDVGRCGGCGCRGRSGDNAGGIDGGGGGGGCSARACCSAPRLALQLHELLRLTAWFHVLGCHTGQRLTCTGAGEGGVKAEAQPCEAPCVALWEHACVCY
eukprot:365494-Chlamydomonas_euryale.AAC.3